jgi:alpha-tubulin suppressor-like RCC1 family protein
MSIATSRTFVATAYDGTLELWNPACDIRTVHTVPDLRVVKVECTHQGGVALTDDGKVVFFGYGNRMTYQTDEFITDIASGERDLLMTTKSGNFIWEGKRSNFLKTTTAPPPLKVAIGPAKIAYISNGKLWIGNQHIAHSRPVTNVAVGGGHTVFIDDSGMLYGFGYNKKGQLGRGIVEFIRDPTNLPFWTRLRKVVAGHEHTVLLDVNGITWICGSNYNGQMGPEIDKTEDCRFGFMKLRVGIVDIAARGNLTMLLFANGDIEQLGTRT